MKSVCTRALFIAGLVISLVATGCEAGDFSEPHQDVFSASDPVSCEEDPTLCPGPPPSDAADVGPPLVLHVDTSYYDVDKADWDPTPTPKQIVLGTSNMIEVSGERFSDAGCPSPGEVTISLERGGYAISALPAIYIDMAGCNYDGAGERHWALGLLGLGASTVASGPADLIITNAWGLRSTPTTVQLVHTPFEVTGPTHGGNGPTPTVGIDADGDGFVQNGEGIEDCDDSNASIFPGAEEQQNEQDDDCDGAIDEGFFSSACGDGICQPGEGANCPVDCGGNVECTQDDHCGPGQFCQVFECNDDCFIDDDGEIRCEESCFGECRNFPPATPCDMEELTEVGVCMSECGTDFGCMFNCSQDRINEGCLGCIEPPMSNLGEFCGEACEHGDADDPNCRECLCESGTMAEVMGCAGMDDDCHNPPPPPGHACDLTDLLHVGECITECGGEFECAFDCTLENTGEECTACTEGGLSLIQDFCGEDCSDASVHDPSCHACLCAHGIVGELTSCGGMPDNCHNPIDGDGDGVASDQDCNDGNPNIFPGAPEQLNAIDDNCNGLIDEGIPGEGCTHDGQCGPGQFCEIFECTEADCFINDVDEVICEETCFGECQGEFPPHVDCFEHTMSILDECLSSCGGNFDGFFCMNSCIQEMDGQLDECGMCAQGAVTTVIFSCEAACLGNAHGDDCLSCLCGHGVAQNIAECQGAHNPCGGGDGDECDVDFLCDADHECIDGECVFQGFCFPSCE
ncbi:MAG: putative metal-binding motif-containing protein, partial [Myxococcota bacterium]|nr:putative metal-binding motif-containing protein [Myxococcota bacterium]